MEQKRRTDVELRRQMKALQDQMRALEQRLNQENRENAHLTIKALNDQLSSMKRVRKRQEKEHLLLAIEREEDNIANALRQKLSEKIKEKVELENSLEAEQEMMFNCMTKQVAQNVTDRMCDINSAYQRKAEAEIKSRSVSDVESTKECESLEEIFTDSSVSSDTEGLREAEEDQRKQKLLEIELLELKRQRKAAKREMLRCIFHIDKAMFESLELTQKELVRDAAARKRPFAGGHRHAESELPLSMERMDLSLEVQDVSSNPASLNTSQEIQSPGRCRAASMTKQA